MSKKIISLVLATMMVVAMLTACSTDAPATETPTTDPGTQPEATPAVDEPALEDVTIEFWDMVVGGVNYPTKAGEMAKKITEEYPHITIKYTSIPWANRYETFTTAIASGEAPDMSTGGGYQSFQYAAAGEILDLSSIIDEWEADGTLDNYNMDYIDYFQSEGIQVGIPWNFEPRYMAYRKDWFEAEGIPVPTTWDELYDAAVHFTDPSEGIYGLAYAASGSSGNVLFNIWLSMNDGGLWTPDGLEPDWVNPKNLEALNFISKLNEAGVLPEGMAAYETNEVVQLAAQDSVAMVVLIMGNGFLLAEAGAADKWALMPVPAGPSANGNEGYVAAINAIMAYSQTDHPTETKQALKWWSENMFSFWTDDAAAVSGIPVRNDWLNDPAYVSNMADPMGPDFISYALESTHTLVSPATNITSWLTQNAFDGERWWTALSQAVLFSEYSNEELLQQWQDKAIATINDFK